MLPHVLCKCHGRAAAPHSVCGALQELAGCAALTELNASGNILQTVPAALGRLQELQVLNLNKNRCIQSVCKVPLH